MDRTPKGNRLHIALFGRTNVGKSSLLNFIVGQDVAIISPLAGTTTDVVEKAMELLPLGPVVFLDTAGIDDVSPLAALRVKKSHTIFDRADIVLLLVEPDTWTEYEEEIAREVERRGIPLIAVVNKVDLAEPSPEFVGRLRERMERVVLLSCADRAGPCRNSR